MRQYCTQQEHGKATTWLRFKLATGGTRSSCEPHVTCIMMKSYSDTAKLYCMWELYRMKHLPQWQKSDEITKRLSGSARYLLNSWPYFCSLSVDKEPTSTGTMVNWPWRLQQTEHKLHVFPMHVSRQATDKEATYGSFHKVASKNR